MRRGFTLIELLVVIAILAAMMGVATVSFSSGRGAFRLKGAARDVFAAIRQARSIALVTQKPCIITYGEVSRGDTVCAQVTLTGTKLMNDTGPQTAWTLSGEPVVVGGDEEELPPAEANDADAPAPSGGHTVAEALFPSISEEVLEGVRIKVVSGQENLPLSEGETEMRRARTSIYSNVDYLLEKYKKARADEKAAADAAKAESDAEEPAPRDAAAVSGQEAVSFVWQVNGRCEPHRVYVYAAGSEPQDGLVIVVDRFGAAKVLSGDEEGRE